MASVGEELARLWDEDSLLAIFQGTAEEIVMMTMMVVVMMMMMMVTTYLNIGDTE